MERDKKPMSMPAAVSELAAQTPFHFLFVSILQLQMGTLIAHCHHLDWHCFDSKMQLVQKGHRFISQKNACAMKRVCLHRDIMRNGGEKKDKSSVAGFRDVRRCWWVWATVLQNLVYKHNHRGCSRTLSFMRFSRVWMWEISEVSGNRPPGFGIP